MSALVFAAAILLGFLLPGYLVSRIARSPCWFVSTVVFSVLALFQVVFWLQVCGLPLRFQTVGGALAAICLALLALHRLAGGAELKLPRPGLSGRQWAWVVPGIALTGLLAYRLVKAPLMGPDTLFRWDFLARQMLALGNFSSYPPRQAADYAFYFFPDGFSPLVSATYFWVYAALGRPEPAATTVPVLLQAGAVLLVVYTLGRELFSRAAGIYAVCLLASAVLFLWGILMGQETGYTALSLGSALFFIARAQEEDARGAMILAGGSAALGALARDYGGIFVACGAAAILWRKLGWRSLAVYTGTALALCGPWYLRSWVLTGNPLYSNEFGNLFPVNPVHAAILRENAAAFALARLPARGLQEAWETVRAGAPLPVLAGLLGVGRARRHPDLLFSLVLVGLTWVYATGSSSGIPYSMRMLTPALLILALLGGEVLSRAASAAPLWRRPVSVAAGGCVAFGICFTALYPIAPSAAALRDAPRLLTESYPSSGTEYRKRFGPRLAPGARVLSDNAYAHAALSGTGVEVVPVWSPEVSFVFDPALSPREVRGQLLLRGIGWVLYSGRVVNARYLDRQPFYAFDRGQWLPVESVNDWTLFQLPEAS